MTSLPPSDEPQPPRANRPSEPDPSGAVAGLAPLVARALGAGPDVVPGACSVCGTSALVLRVTRDDRACLICLRCLEDSDSREFGKLAHFFRCLTMPVGRASRHLTADLDPSALCTECGVTFADVSRTGLLGCPRCYEAFAAAVEPGLLRLHPVP